MLHPLRSNQGPKASWDPCDPVILTLTRFSFPVRTAVWRGASWLLSRSVVSASASRRISTMLTWPPKMALWRAVRPDLSSWLTSKKNKITSKRKRWQQFCWRSWKLRQKNLALSQPRSQAFADKLYRWRHIRLRTTGNEADPVLLILSVSGSVEVSG